MILTYIVSRSNNTLFVTDSFTEATNFATSKKHMHHNNIIEQWKGAHVLRTFSYSANTNTFELKDDHKRKVEKQIEQARKQVEELETKYAEMEGDYE